jgi:hypothetical protein
LAECSGPHDSESKNNPGERVNNSKDRTEKYDFSGITL